MGNDDIDERDYRRQNKKSSYMVPSTSFFFTGMVIRASTAMIADGKAAGLASECESIFRGSSGDENLYQSLPLIPLNIKFQGKNERFQLESMLYGINGSSIYK